MISICLPILNARRFLRERMDTILSQVATDWELIVCDSYSDDGSWELLQSFKNDPRIRLFQVAREGLYAGWNECLRRAKGEFVYIATADDTIIPQGLDRLRTVLLENPNTAVAVCNFQVIDEAGKCVPGPPNPWQDRFYGGWMNEPHVRNGRTEAILHACLGIIWWTVSAVMFRRSLLDRIGLFRTDRGSQADEEWEMRAALAADIAFLPEKLATWRRHPAQATAHLRPYNRTNLDCLEAVLLDDKSGIPVAWKCIPDWEGKITHICRMEYYCSYGLFRGVARKDPRQFIRNVMTALLREPELLIRQASRGFKWSPVYSPDPLATARELIDVFGCEWPPRKM